MDIIAGSDAETLRQTLRSRRRLVAEEVRAELVASGEAPLAELAGRVHDRGEESLADLLADLDAARLDRQVTELREIETAEGRLADGSYGRCVDCDGPIGLPRLHAWPTALRCIDCQTRHEHAFAHPGTPRL